MTMTTKNPDVNVVENINQKQMRVVANPVLIRDSIGAKDVVLPVAGCYHVLAAQQY